MKDQGQKLWPLFIIYVKMLIMFIVISDILRDSTMRTRKYEYFVF